MKNTKSFMRSENVIKLYYENDKGPTLSGFCFLSFKQIKPILNIFYSINNVFLKSYNIFDDYLPERRNEMSEIKITRPTFPVLFGGLGFHNSEALFYRLMEKEHFDQKIAKCYREIQPGFMRAFAGYDDWTRDSMDTFADYYERMQKVTDTPIYLAAAMGKIHFSAILEFESKFTYTVSEYACIPNSFISRVFPTCRAPSIIRGFRRLLSFHFNSFSLAVRYICSPLLLYYKYIIR